MSIRLQLLIIALTTLVLPWAGCQYARELESTLRMSQENSLQAAAETIANALSAQSQRVFSNIDGEQPFDPKQGDLYVFPLHAEPLLDGYREDWDLDVEPKVLPSDGLTARLQAGFTEHYLMLYAEVDAPHFTPEPREVLPQQGGFDRVNVVWQRPDGSLDSCFFATSAPGLIQAQRVEATDGGTLRVAVEPRIQAFWLQTSHGYHLEARIPRSMVGSRLWVEAVDGQGRKAGFMGAHPLGSDLPGSDLPGSDLPGSDLPGSDLPGSDLPGSDLPGGNPPRGGRLIMATPGLSGLLGTFIGTGTRATVVDANALKLGSAGSVMLNKDDPDEAEGTWYRRFVAGDTSRWPAQISLPDRLEGHSVNAALAGHAAAEWLRAGPSGAALLSAAAPIVVGGRIHGAVVLEQAGDQLVDVRDRALNRLFNLTLFATALAVAFAFGVATWISVRIDRLRLAADTAVTADGRIRLDMPESQSSDEIGALSRGFQRLLARLNEHTLYLRALGGKLSHELRTPLTIVRSSLDNLESEGLRPDQRGYVTRAREGTLRLQSILSALGASSRVEESIKQAERVNFDLKQLLESAALGYRDGFPSARIALEAPAGACFMHGAPDLLVQMLDKLIENAVDFCTAAGVITVRLARAGGNYEIAVDNEGPPIPTELVSRLFESLFEHRQGVDDKPHFGLGLYIVRLIAEFHGGHAAAANRADGGGAVFTVTLPMI